MAERSRQSNSYPPGVALNSGGRGQTYPHLNAFTWWFGTRVRTTPPNPLTVWVAELHDMYSSAPPDDRYSFRLSVTGNSEGDALARLDKLIGEMRGLPDG